MTSYVTIEKDYLETLLRKTENVLLSSKLGAPQTITISKADHDDMIRKCREYENLKQALYRGGVDQKSIETLICSHECLPTTTTTATGTTTTATPVHEDRQFTGRGERNYGAWQPRQSFDSRNSKNHAATPSSHQSFDNDNDSLPSDDKLDSLFPGDAGDGPSTTTSSSKQRSSGENRTITFKNVPERATHRDVAAVVRGGALVDLFLRSRDRVASVSFAETKAAQDFFTYAKRVTIYILNCPIEVTWAERQYSLSSYLNTQLSYGASRNLIIRNIHPNITESMIREDMRHIHNLIVVDVKFERGNAYISTNSIQKASFARNCMMSRMPYRMVRVEYYPDDCAAALPKVSDQPKKEASRPLKPLNPMANRFQMLNLDETDDDSDDQDDILTHGALGGGIAWRNNTIAV
ncbi:hypothetical protein FQN57_007548 [Myotisia sp. PD_48]|nr:hypothetical protein FQN57_007548 [Myotisia sp. PD_48]